MLNKDPCEHSRQDKSIQLFSFLVSGTNQGQVYTAETGLTCLELRALVRRTLTSSCSIFLSYVLEMPAAAAAKSLQSRPTLCHPIDGSSPGSPSLGFSRQEHWSGLPFPSPMHESEKWKWSHSVSVWLFMTPGTAAYQAPPSMGFSRQEYWSGVPLPSPRNA